MTAVSLVDMDAAGLDTGQPLQLGDQRPQGVPVEQVAVQSRWRAAHKLAARCLALADALHLGE